MPWTDVPGRVKRKPAQRARWPAGGNHPPRSINESSRLARLDAVGRDGSLLLFQRDRSHPHGIDRLQVKRAFPRHANGPGDESARAVKEVELASHSAIQPIRRWVCIAANAGTTIEPAQRVQS